MNSLVVKRCSPCASFTCYLVLLRTAWSAIFLISIIDISSDAESCEEQDDKKSAELWLNFLAVLAWACYVAQ